MTILHIADLVCPLFVPISLPHLPVSLLLCQWGLGDPSRRQPTVISKTHPTHLLVGLGNGNLHVYGLNFAHGLATVGEQKLISLGSTKPVFIAPFRLPPEEGGTDKQNVLACGSRPVVLYWENGRLKHSPLVRKVRVSHMVYIVASGLGVSKHRGLSQRALLTPMISLPRSYSQQQQNETGRSISQAYLLGGSVTSRNWISRQHVFLFVFQRNNSSSIRCLDTIWTRKSSVHCSSFAAKCSWCWL